MTASYDDCTEVVGNLCKARNSWERLSKILGREGANPRVSGMLFKVMVQAVLIFGSKPWVTTPCTGRALGGFKQRVDIQITGRNT